MIFTVVSRISYDVHLGRFLNFFPLPLVILSTVRSWLDVLGNCSSFIFPACLSLLYVNYNSSWFDELDSNDELPLLTLSLCHPRFLGLKCYITHWQPEISRVNRHDHTITFLYVVLNAIYCVYIGCFCSSAEQIGEAAA